jgi:hypothetical protein
VAERVAKSFREREEKREIFIHVICNTCMLRIVKSGDDINMHTYIRRLTFYEVTTSFAGTPTNSSTATFAHDCL